RPHDDEACHRALPTRTATTRHDREPASWWHKLLPPGGNRWCCAAASEGALSGCAPVPPPDPTHSYGDPHAPALRDDLSEFADDMVDEAVFLGLSGAEPAVVQRILVDLVVGPAGVLGDQAEH